MEKVVLQGGLEMDRDRRSVVVTLISGERCVHLDAELNWHSLNGGVVAGVIQRRLKMNTTYPAHSIRYIEETGTEAWGNLEEYEKEFQ